MAVFESYQGRSPPSIPLIYANYLKMKEKYCMFYILTYKIFSCKLKI